MAIGKSWRHRSHYAVHFGRNFGLGRAGGRGDNTRKEPSFGGPVRGADGDEGPIAYEGKQGTACETDTRGGGGISVWNFKDLTHATGAMIERQG